MILLDTNFCAAALRSERRVAARLMQHGGRIHIPWVVAAELKYGVEKLDRSGVDAGPLRGRLAQFLSVIGGVAMVTNATLEAYAAIRADLEAAGKPIGANDLWIAALAVAENALLVTDNVREFKRVPHLQIENWLSR